MTSVWTVIHIRHHCKNQRKIKFMSNLSLESHCLEPRIKFMSNLSLESHCLEPRIIGSDHFPAGNCMFKVNNRNTRTRCEICSKLTIKTPRRSGVFIVNFEHISHLVLVFLLLTLSK